MLAKSWLIIIHLVLSLSSSGCECEGICQVSEFVFCKNRKQTSKQSSNSKNKELFFFPSYMVFNEYTFSVLFSVGKWWPDTGLNVTLGGLVLEKSITSILKHALLSLLFRLCRVCLFFCFILWTILLSDSRLYSMSVSPRSKLLMQTLKMSRAHFSEVQTLIFPLYLISDQTYTIQGL